MTTGGAGGPRCAAPVSSATSNDGQTGQRGPVRTPGGAPGGAAGPAAARAAALTEVDQDVAHTIILRPCAAIRRGTTRPRQPRRPPARDEPGGDRALARRPRPA